MGRVFDFIANCGDGVFAVDRRQSIVLWNDRAKAILGFSAKEVLGRKCYTILGANDARGRVVCRRDCEAISQAVRLRPAVTREVEARTRNGGTAWLSCSTMIAPSRHGDLSLLIHLFRETTKERGLLIAAREFAAVLAAQASGTPKRRSPGSPDRAAPVKLTPREREILTALTSGTSTDSIADRLCISRRTVRNHVNNILGKLEVHSRLEAVAYAISNGLV